MVEIQQNQESPSIIMKPQHSLSIIGVLREALNTTLRNGKLVVSIFYQLELATMLALTPLTEEVKSSFETRSASSYTHTGSSQRPKPRSYGSFGPFIPRVDVRILSSPQWENRGSYGFMDQSTPIPDAKGRVQAVYLITLLFFLVAAISSTYEAHTKKVVSLKDVLLAFRRSWKRVIHTSFCLTLISLGLLFLHTLFSVLIQIFPKNSSTAYYILYAMLIVPSSIAYLHMAVQWMLSLVVSVLESDSSGLIAFNRARELMKGKRIQAYVLMLLFHFAFGTAHMISSVMAEKLDGWATMAIVTIPLTAGLICVLKVFMFAVYTVYYHDSKVSREKEGAKEQPGLYAASASDEAS